MLKKLWVETFRPTTLAEMLLTDPQRREFQAIIDSKSLPNLLLTGTRGTGKSTLSTVLVKAMGVHDMDVMYLNCSDDKIEAIRDRVKSFAFTMPMGNFKVVRLEEMDNLSLDAQKLLRGLIEDVSDSCRFIGTGNYLNKILPAVQDRFEMHDFKGPTRDEIAGKLVDILTAVKVKFEVEDVLKIAEAGYPSVRQATILLEKCSKSGTLVLNGDSTATDWKLNLLPHLESNNLSAARKVVCEQASKEELVDVYRFVFQNLHRVPKLKNKEDAAVIVIAQYQYQHQFVQASDAEIQLAAMFAELGAL